MLWSSPAITDESTNPDGWLQPFVRPGHSPTGGPGRTSHWLACNHNGSTTRLRDADGGCQGIEPWNALRGTSPSRPTPTDCVCDRLSQRINTGYRVPRPPLVWRLISHSLNYLPCRDCCRSGITRAALGLLHHHSAFLHLSTTLGVPAPRLATH